jgi:hypothetical protein
MPANNRTPSLRDEVAFPWWLHAVVCVGATLMIVGAGVALFHPALLVSPHDFISGAVQIYAGYMASRNLALGLMLLTALVLRARALLNGLLLLTAFVQLIDAVVDCTAARWAIAPGVVCFGVIFLIAAWRISGYAFWRVEFWRNGALLR